MILREFMMMHDWYVLGLTPQEIMLIKGNNNNNFFSRLPLVCEFVNAFNWMGSFIRSKGTSWGLFHQILYPTTTFNTLCFGIPFLGFP
jgi:hypothetical protein